MSGDRESVRLADLVDDLEARLDDLEAELDDALAEGQTRLTETTRDLRRRVVAMRGMEPEPEPTRVQRLRQDLDELTAAIEAEVEAMTETLSSVLADVNRQVRELKSRLRGR